MRELVFVDTESTGLADHPEAELVELTWATRDSEPETLYFGVTEVPDFINRLIKFDERKIAGLQSDHFAIERFLKASMDNTMVAANPSHDKHFLYEAGIWRFHYRMLDIETYAMAKLCSVDVPSMTDLTTELRMRGHEITKPDHTSRNDVLAMRDAFLILESM